MSRNCIYWYNSIVYKFLLLMYPIYNLNVDNSHTHCDNTSYTIDSLYMLPPKTLYCHTILSNTPRLVACVKYVYDLLVINGSGCVAEFNNIVNRILITLAFAIYCIFKDYFKKWRYSNSYVCILIIPTVMCLVTYYI